MKSCQCHLIFTRRFWTVFALTLSVLWLLASLSTPLRAAPPHEPPTPTPSAQPETWISGETSVLRLSEAERAGLCGVPEEVIEWERLQASLEALEPQATYAYPAAKDWRNLSGQDWTTAIRNQASCGSCTAFGTIGAIESRIEIANGNPNLNPDLSEAHLFYCGCGACCGTGWSPASAMDFARDTGIVDEGCYRYTAQNQSCNPCSDWQNRVNKVASWSSTSNAAEMKQALADHGPFEATMAVYDDFFSYAGGVYRHISGSLAGYHAITIVGYDDVGGYWIAKNSWGADWGEDKYGNPYGGGWFRIAYGECGIDDYVYVPAIGDVPTDCITGDFTWQYDSLPTQSDTFTVEFDATPLGDEIDALVALSQGPGDTPSDYAAIVRFYTNGRIQARNGSGYGADTTISYSAGTTYHFRMVIDVPSHTYTVYVDTPAQQNIILASQYAFRSEQSDVTSLDNWGVWAKSIGHQVCNFTLAGDVRVVNAWTADGNWSPKTTFASGDPIQWVIDVENTTGEDALIALTYDARGPNGEQVAYWDGTLTTSAGTLSWGLPGTVPGGMSGIHTFTGSGVYHGTLSQAATTYTVSANADLLIDPASTTVGRGDIFTLDVKVQAGGQSVDSVDSFLSFDRNYLRVVNAAGNETNQVTPGIALPNVLQNSVDNSQGRITFSAGRPLTGNPPSGDFVLATIRFKAIATNTGGTTVQFLSGSDIYYQGTSVLGSLQGGLVQIQNASLSGKVTLQGRGNPPGSSWSGFPLLVELYAPGDTTPLSSYASSTDDSGYFAVPDVSPGTYDVRVKNAHTLSNRRRNVSITNGSNVIDFGTLLEGDASNNDVVRGEDYSILATTYFKCSGQNGWDARADFNGDSCVRGNDYSLLAMNYNRRGPIDVSGASSLNVSDLARTVILNIDPSTRNVEVGNIVTLNIRVKTGGQGVDAVDAVLNYDPSYLHVVDSAGNEVAQIEPGASMPVVLHNHVDNQSGQIAFSAGRQLGGEPVTGDFSLATLHVKLIASTASTSVTFSSSDTDAYLNGYSILLSTQGSTIGSQAEGHKVYLPIVVR
jgi:C1A family cysteine protease